MYENINYKSLKKLIKSSSPVCVLFYSDNVESQILSLREQELFKEINIKIVKFKITPKVKKEFLIQKTPILVIFRNGVEIHRISVFKDARDLYLRISSVT